MNYNNDLHGFDCNPVFCIRILGACHPQGFARQLLECDPWSTTLNSTTSDHVDFTYSIPTTHSGMDVRNYRGKSERFIKALNKF